MTVQEFWNLIDSIDVDSRDDGMYTEDELYNIGCSFIELNNSQKREIGGWDKITEVLKPLDRNGEPMKKGDTFRQWIKSRKYQKDEMVHNDHMISGKNIDEITFDEFEDKTEEIKRNLYIQQVKTRDIANSYRRTLRDEARIQNIKDLIKESIESLGKLPKVEYSERYVNEDAEAVMLISDLHVGMQIDNYANKYNVEIARARLNAYVEETIRLCKEAGVKRLNIANLNDLVSGVIHVTLRVEQEEDVISQIMIASEIMADALNKLQKAAPEVIYRSVTDNHSRAVASFSEHIEKENLCRLIDFYLEARMANTNIVFAKDNLDYDISKIDLMNGKVMICSHGHRDNINTIIQGYIGALKQYVDYVAVGHFHESKMKSFQGAKVFVNGSICGSDPYAQSKRLYGNPEQTLIVFKGRTLSQHLIDLSEV